MWNPIPWFVNGGDHTPAVARLLAYAATQGAEGVVEPADCKVVAKAAPSAAVDVLPGAIIAPNRAATAGRESYLAQNPEAEEIEITPTGSSGGRTDLLIARIEDPDFVGARPEDPSKGPYIFTRKIEGVPANTTRVQQLAGHTNDTAVTLARITRPANRTVVEPGHITDLRKISQSRNVAKTFMTGMNDAPFKQVAIVFPSWGAYLNVAMDIPEWATHFSAVATIAGIQVGGQTAGAIALALGYDQPGQVTGAATQYDENSGASAANPQRFTHMCAISGKVPASFRGTSKNLTLLANIFPGSYSLNFDGSTTVVVQYEFHADVI
jgi:hypothetical protein